MIKYGAKPEQVSKTAQKDTKDTAAKKPPTQPAPPEKPKDRR